MAPARIQPGTIGTIDWDYERTPGMVRGVARTRDGADKVRRVVAVRATREEVESELRSRAASLLFKGEVWSPQTTLGEAIERWIVTLGDADEGNTQREQSVETYARTARGVIVPRLGAIAIGELTTPQLRDFMVEMRKAPHRTSGGVTRSGYSVSYRLHILRALRDSLALAVSMGAIPSNPARDVPRPSKKTYNLKSPRRALNQSQVSVLRQCLRAWEKAERPGPARGPQLRLAIELGLATGCRIGEVCGFLMEEVSDLPTLRLAVTGTMVTVRGKTFRSDRLKGDEQARVLELPNWAGAVIDECRTVASRAGSGAPLLQGSRGAFQAPANLRSRLRTLKVEFGPELEAAGIAVDCRRSGRFAAGDTRWVRLVSIRCWLDSAGPTSPHQW